MAVKFGYKYGPRCIIHLGLPMTASQRIRNNGGHFVYMDVNKNGAIALEDTDEIVGWVEGGEFTTSSTDGGTIMDIDISPWSVYLIPADEAVTSALRFEVCGLVVNDYIQSADVGETDEDIVRIIRTDAANQAVWVHMNPNKLCATVIS